MNAEELVPNPFVKIREHHENGELIAVKVIVPVRGQGIKVTTFMRADDPSLIDTLLRVHAADDSVEFELTDDQMSALAESGFLVPSERMPETIVYQCTLGDVEPVAPRSGPLAPNPTLHLRRDGALPSEVGTPATALAPCFLPGTPMAWIRDGRTGLLSPFWLEAEEADALEALQAGRDPWSLEPALLHRFVGADLVVPPGRLDELAAEARAIMAERDRELAQSGFVLLRKLLPTPQMRALRRYYAGLVREGMLRWGDEMVPRRYVMPDEGCARFWHEQLTATVQHLVAEPTKASYSYVSVYEAGAELRKHIDREQCEFSITFMVDYSPTPETVSDWPLFLEVGDPPRAVPVHFGIGDGLLYFGRTQPHFRDVLPEGRRSTHIFFHYVKQDFTGPLI
jgi:hypothetical protein